MMGAQWEPSSLIPRLQQHHLLHNTGWGMSLASRLVPFDSAGAFIIQPQLKQGEQKGKSHVI
jgi:hypothetical protein